MATGCLEGTGGEREVEALSLKNSHEQVESLWIRISDRGNDGNLVVGVYYRPPDQGETSDEAFSLQLQEALCSQSLVPLGDLNHRITESQNGRGWKGPLWVI